MIKAEGLISNPYGGTVLFGKEDSGVVEDAIELAEKIANYGTKNIVKFGNHPDCHFIELEEGKREITLEQVDEIKVLQNVIPLHSRVNVFVIAHADRMSNQVQNSLLKVLEDGSSNNCFLMCCENRLIETIMNRCSIIFAGHEIDDKVLKDKSTELNVPLWVVNTLSDGRELWLTDPDFAKVSKMISQFESIKERREVLFILDALKEKSENSFVKTTSEKMVLALINSLECIIMAVVCKRNSVKKIYDIPERVIELFDDYPLEKLFEVLKQLESSKLLVKRKVFTNNDYFNVIRLLAD